jgi:hypothetical protein
VDVLTPILAREKKGAAGDPNWRDAEVELKVPIAIDAVCGDEPGLAGVSSVSVKVAPPLRNWIVASKDRHSKASTVGLHDLRPLDANQVLRCEMRRNLFAIELMVVS